MQTLPIRPSRLVQSCRTGVLLLALATLGTGCDRHSATEAPESYGHGSSHQDNYSSHKIDSRVGSNHFSDTRGVTAEKEETGPEAAKAARSGEGQAATPNPMGIGR